MVTPLFNSSLADVVFVGGGPVALWTAIQTKLQNSQLNVVVLEKYADYKRIHHLFIESASLKTNCSSPDLDKFIRQMKSHRVVSTKTLENSLAELAEKVGVIIQRNVEIFNPEQDLKPYSNARVIVGADGAHSIMRQYVVGEVPGKCFESKEDLHYIADLTYSETQKPINTFAKISMNSTVGNCIYEIHSEKSKRTTLRTFIPPEIYEKMKQATRKNPENLYGSVVQEKVRQEFLTFLKSKYGNELEKCIDLTEATVTTTALGSYISKKMVKKENGRIWCLVGDAAFGVPFFRSLNNGLISGTRLAQSIAATFKGKENKVFSSLKNRGPFEDYEAFVQDLAHWEVRIANAKSFGVNLWIRIAKIFHHVIGPSEYLKASLFVEE